VVNKQVGPRGGTSNKRNKRVKAGVARPPLVQTFDRLAPNNQILGSIKKSSWRLLRNPRAVAAKHASINKRSKANTARRTSRQGGSFQGTSPSTIKRKKGSSHGVTRGF